MNKYIINFKNILIIFHLSTALKCNQLKHDFEVLKTYSYLLDQNNLDKKSEFIGNELLKTSVYHSFETNKNYFNSLNLKLDKLLLERVSSICLLNKIINTDDKYKVSKLSNVEILKNYQIKKKAQNKIPRVILQIISNYVGSLLNTCPNNKNTLLDKTKYSTEEYNLVQMLGGLNSLVFIEKKISETYGSQKINHNLLEEFIREGNFYFIFLTLCHPNIKKVLISPDKYHTNFNNIKKLSAYLIKYRGPKFNKTGLQGYYFCEICKKNYWKYFGKGHFNIVILVRKGFSCHYCNKITKNLKTLAINCNYLLEMQKFSIINSYPYIKNSGERVENHQIASTEDVKFFVLDTLGSIAYLTIDIF